MEASRRRFLLIIAAAAAAVFASSAIFWASAEFPPDFCTSRRLSSPPTAAPHRRCPTPPAAASLYLPTLLGSYYEIGSSARYKIKYELGMACSRTTFSPSSSSPSDDDAGDDDDDDSGDSSTTFSDSGDASPTSSGRGHHPPRINVVTTGMPVVFGRQTLEAVARIASAAANVCVTAERLCAMSMPQSRTAEALLRIAAVSDQMADGATAPSLETAALAQATGVVNASVLAVQACLDRLARSVSMVATMNAGLSQKVGGGGLGATEVLLREVRSSAEEGMEQARRVGSLVISNLTFASDLVEMAAVRLGVSDDSTGNAASLLQEASALLQAEIQHISAQVTTIQGLLSSVGGPLADMVAAEGRSEAAVGSSAEAEAAANASRVVLRNGEAVQEGGERGNLVLREAVAGSAAAAAEVETPFRVLAVVPPDGGEYAAVLIETCEGGKEEAAAAAEEEGEAVGGAARSELIILSRTRTLTPETVIGLLTGAAANGVFADCDSPFVLTLQSHDDCSDYSN